MTPDTAPNSGQDRITGSAARPAEEIARRFHEEYEHLAPAYGYETRHESAVPWEDVPEQNRKLMVHVVGNLLASNIIDVGSNRA